MKEIIEKYLSWKTGNSPDDSIDNIHDMISELSRNELYKIFEYLTEQYYIFNNK